MKLTHKRTVSVFIVLMLPALIFVHPVNAANDLQYSGMPNPLADSAGQAQSADSRLVPVSYNTNYGAQFSPYASFMQSPYGNPAYAGGAYGAGSSNMLPPSQMGQGPNPYDPYAASEVSPYSRYSPYIEVIGEGSDYTLGIDDVLTIIIRNQPDFSGRFVIDPDGNVQYPFVGDLKASGKTKAEFKQDLLNALKKFVRYPEVAVMISEYRSKAVYVFGSVGRPGKYAMKGNKISVKEAIVAAGLPAMDGSLKRAYVIRPSEFTKDGKAKKKKIDLKKLIWKGDSSEDFILLPGDTLVVHQKYFDQFMNSYAKLMGPLFETASVYSVAFGAPDNGLFGGDNKK